MDGALFVKGEGDWTIMVAHSHFSSVKLYNQLENHL